MSRGEGVDARDRYLTNAEIAYWQEQRAFVATRERIEHDLADFEQQPRTAENDAAIDRLRWYLTGERTM
jgi:hypothetical protein